MIAAGNGADAVWLTNEYGDVISFTRNAASQTTVSFEGSVPGAVFAHVHYGDCRHGVSQRLITWHATVQSYLVSDTSQTFGDPNDLFGDAGSGRIPWSPTEKAQAMPTFDDGATVGGRVDYGNKQATPTFVIPRAKQAKMAYVATGEGTILAFRNSDLACNNNGGCTKSLAVSIPSLEHTLSACVALCEAAPPTTQNPDRNVCDLTETQCAAFNLLPAIVQELDAIGASGSATSVPISWPSTQTVVVDAPQTDAACGIPPNDYVLYTSSGNTIALAHSKPLVLAMSTAACDYTQAGCTLAVSVVCGASTQNPTRRAISVDLSATFSVRGSIATSTSGNAPKPSECDQHRGVGTTWRNSRGQVCECFNDVVECSAPKDDRLYLDSAQAGLVAAFSCVLFCVMIVICLRLYYVRQDARQLPIGGQRRSLVYSRKPDYVTSKSHKGEEVELPAPPSAGASVASFAEEHKPPPPPERPDDVQQA